MMPLRREQAVVGPVGRQLVTTGKVAVSLRHRLQQWWPQNGLEVEGIAPQGGQGALGVAVLWVRAWRVLVWASVAVT